MEIKKIQTSDFKSVAQRNDFFLWSFLQHNQGVKDLSIWSLFDDKTNRFNQAENKLVEFLKIFPINFYESFVDESIDFLLDFGIPYDKMYRKIGTNVPKENYYLPSVFLFKKYRMIDSTLNHCYCIEGLTEMLIKNIPDILEKSNLD